MYIPFNTTKKATQTTPSGYIPFKKTITPTKDGTKLWNGMEIPENVGTKNLIAYDPKTGIKTFKFPDKLGGGTYSEDKDNNIVLTPRGYGGVEIVSGSQRDHIVPVALGGGSTKENIKVKKVNPVATEMAVINAVKSGELSSKAAITKILRDKYDLENKPTFLKSILNNIINQTTEPVQKLKDVIPDTKEEIEFYKQAIKDQPKTAQEYITKQKQPLKTIGGTIGESVKNLNVAISKQPTKKGFNAENVADTLNVVSSVADVLFSPISGVFAAAEEVPGLRLAAQVITLPFAVGGKVGEFASGKFVDVLPISQEAKDTLKPAFERIGSLTGMILLGGKIMKIIKEGNVVDKKAINNAVKEIKIENRTPEAVEVPIRMPVEPPKLTPETPLAQEARKYKSAEEFVKAQATLKHRSVTPDIKQFEPNESGIFFTKDAYGERYRGKDVHITNAYVDLKNPFIASKENVIKLYMDNYGLDKKRAGELADNFEMALSIERQQVKGFIEDKYDGMIIPEDWDGGFGTIESVVVFDPKQIYTKSQLTDIWNKAQEKPIQAPTTKQEVKVDPLAQEARKYKSAEEFVDKMRGSNTQFSDYAPNVRKFGIGDKSKRISDLGIDSEKEITIYRGVSDVSGKAKRINDGDFVTTSYEQALNYTDNPQNVVSKKVKAKDLISQYPDEFIKDVKDYGFDVAGEGELIYSDSKNPIVNLTKSQLTDIWNKAVKPEVKGVETSGIAKSIEAKAIEEGLTKGLKDMAGFDPITIEGQKKIATKLFSDIEKARKVIMGEEPLPDGLNPVSAIIAMEEYVKKNPDIKLIEELANSRLISETSVAAQTLRLAAEREPDSATAKFQELKKAREEKTHLKDINKTKKELTKKYETETKKVNLPKEELSWNRFLESIIC